MKTLATAAGLLALIAIAPGDDIELAIDRPPVPVTVYKHPTLDTTTTTELPVPVRSVQITANVIWADEQREPAPASPRVPADAHCPDYWTIALGAGWPGELLPIVDEIMFRESSCRPTVVSHTNDYGLMQLNWEAHGARFERLGFSQDALLHPAANLALAHYLYEMHEGLDEFRCGFSPWYMSTPDRVGHWCELKEAL